MTSFYTHKDSLTLRQVIALLSQDSIEFDLSVRADKAQFTLQGEAKSSEAIKPYVLQSVEPEKKSNGKKVL